MRVVFIAALFCFAVVIAGNCTASDIVIDGNAIGGLRIGQFVPQLAKERVLRREWQTDENGDRVELLRATVGAGEVEAEIYDGKIWRLTVNKPGLKTRDGVGVGDPVRTLLRKNRSISPEVGGGPALYLISERPCGIGYLTDVEFSDKIPYDLTKATLFKYVGSSHIAQVLVAGCNAAPPRIK